MPGGVVDSFKETGNALGEGAAVALDDDLSAKLNAIYGTDVSGYQKTMLAVRAISAVTGAVGTAKTVTGLGEKAAKAVGKKLDNVAEKMAKKVLLEKWFKGRLKGAEEGMTIAVKGELGEAAAKRTLSRAGYEELPSKLSGNRGIDGVFVKRGSDGNISDIIISESKFSSSGRATLSNTKRMGRQLSDEWIDTNIQKMIRSSDPAVQQTGRLLRNYRSLIRKKANVLDSAGVNRWNRIKILE